MSGAQMIPASAQTDTPSGFVCAAPWATVDRTLYVDVKAYLASVKYNRNVLSTRISAKSKNNVALDQTFLLPRASTNQANSEYEYKSVPNNQMTVISANRPVHIVLTRESGVLDLGLQTVFIISSPIISVKFSNTENAGDAEVNLIVV
jgi:hypothetical protein